MVTGPCIHDVSQLKRYPVIDRDPLQAWDAADELVIAHLKTLELKGKRVLVMNDSFGALSTAIPETELTIYTDSFVSDQGIRMNSKETLSTIHDLNQLSGSYDFVFMKLPKNLSYFEDELCHLSGHLGPQSKLVIGAMVKYLPKTVFDLIQKHIGDTRTSLAEKKARLIFSEFTKKEVKSPYPIQVKIEHFLHPFLNHSNLFSREKLDIGTRFLLENIPTGPYQDILDLGCANGIVGIAAKKKNPTARIIFVDESAMAIESAKANYPKFFEDQASYLWTNCYEGQEKESVDLVLCNPPFHQHQAMGDHIAWQMFVDARSALRQGGMLRVIGNSHLEYPEKLKKIFGNSRIFKKNDKFTIMDAKK